MTSNIYTTRGKLKRPKCLKWIGIIHNPAFHFTKNWNFFMFAFRIRNFMFFKVDFRKTKTASKTKQRHQKIIPILTKFPIMLFFILSKIIQLGPSSYFANDALLYKRATPSLHIYDKYPWFWGHLFDPFWVSSQIHKIAGFRMNQRHYRKKRIVYL